MAYSQKDHEQELANELKLELLVILGTSHLSEQELLDLSKLIIKLGYRKIT